MEKVNFNDLMDKSFGKKLQGLASYYGMEPLLRVLGNILSGFGHVTLRRLDTLKPKAKEHVLAESKSRLRLWKKRNDLAKRK